LVVDPELRRVDKRVEAERREGKKGPPPFVFFGEQKVLGFFFKNKNYFNVT